MKSYGSTQVVISDSESSSDQFNHNQHQRVRSRSSSPTTIPSSTTTANSTNDANNLHSASTSSMNPYSAWSALYDDIDSSSFDNSSPLEQMRYRVARVVHHKIAQWFVVIVIAINAVILGLETIPSIRHGNLLVFHIINWLCMAVFITEVALKLFADGVRFFYSGWNYFDVAVLAISLAPNTGPWSALYALRCLRVLRIISTARPIRLVVESFVAALITATPVFALMFLILYIASLLAVSFFGDDFDEWFGTLPRAMFTMFQVVTLESWAMGIVRPLMVKYPLAWMLFVPYIMLCTWTILNLFIGVVVNTISEIAKRQAEELSDAAHHPNENDAPKSSEYTPIRDATPTR